MYAWTVEPTIGLLSVLMSDGKSARKPLNMDDRMVFMHVSEGAGMLKRVKCLTNRGVMV